VSTPASAGTIVSGRSTSSGTASTSGQRERKTSGRRPASRTGVPVASNRSARRAPIAPVAPTTSEGPAARDPAIGPYAASRPSLISTTRSA
jgi:hypothetical protein